MDWNETEFQLLYYNPCDPPPIVVKNDFELRLAYKPGKTGKVWFWTKEMGAQTDELDYNNRIQSFLVVLRRCLHTRPQKQQQDASPGILWLPLP